MAMLEVLSFILVSLFTNAVLFPGFNQILFTNGLAIINENSTGFILLGIIVCAILKYYQSKMRYARLLHIKMKYGFDSADPTTYERMTVEQAQEIERNLAEWEFPRLFQFAWISDFLRTSTDPGVSRTIVHSGHFLDPNPLISHRRQQDTIHLMTAIAAYPVKSRFHSLAIARINEHHHRYGTKINSDDVLYLVMHFGLAPISWIQRFGYRQLEEFEKHALWVLWRELGCRMGVKYIPETLEQALEWRKQFETHWRWPEKANQDMAMGLLNQIIYPIPNILHPIARKIVASIMDYDIVYYNMLEHLGPSSMLRSVIFDLFTLCGWMIRHFGLPRTKPYQRSPEKANAETGLVNFDYTPYETTPFYITPSKWNLYGPGAMLRRLRGIPLPSSQFFGDGIAFESMGAPFKNPATQSAVEEKVRRQAKILEAAPYGYRPNVGFQATRLLGPVEGHSYGFLRHSFDKSTKYSAGGPHRFDKEFERRGSGYSGLDEITTRDDVEVTHGDI